jgi:phosphoglycolate phosphatase
MARAFTAMVLDLDGTLIDSAPELARAANGALAALGRRVLAEAEVRAMIGDGIEALCRRSLAATGGVPPADGFARALSDLRRHYAAEPPSALYPGVRETLARLKGDGLALGVCTNKPTDDARRLIAALGLGDLVGAVAGGDSFAVRKPDPGHVAGLLARLGHGPKGAVMVGDGENDARAARAAGIPFIAVAYGYAPGPVSALGADAVIARFADIPEALVALAGRV